MVISSMIKSLLFAASLTILLAKPSSAQYYNYLLAGERLFTGASLRLDRFIFTIQRDCNLVLYESKTVTKIALWASGTDGKGEDCYLTLQDDGNLVIYDYEDSAVWESKTGRENGNYVLLLQRDRNVVIYGNSIWTTDTNYGGSMGVVVAAARNWTVGGTGAKQNKVREMGKIREVIN